MARARPISSKLCRCSRPGAARAAQVTSSALADDCGGVGGATGGDEGPATGAQAGQGIQVIVGDIVLDRTAFDVPDQDPARFDGEPLRPYNASPDALLLNYKSSVMTFVPDAAAGLARIQYDPPLAGVQRQPTVALAAP
eukprot:gene52815-72073_t